LARVEALLRRSRRDVVAVEAADEELPLVLEIDRAKVDRRNYRASVGAEDQPVTHRGMKLREILALHVGEVVSREVLLDDAGGVD